MNNKKTSNGKVTCIYHAIVNNNERTDELKRVWKEHGAHQLGIAIYYMMSSVTRKMHMKITEDELYEIGNKVIHYILHGETA